MLQATNKPIFPTYKEDEKIPKCKIPDTFVKKFIEVEEYDVYGTKTVKRQEQLVNVTKLVNESKKILKQTNAEEKLKELEKIFTK